MINFNTMKYMIQIILLLHCSFCSAQKDSDELNIQLDSTKKIFLLGENHFKKNNHHKIYIINELIERYSLKEIYIEAPISFEPFYNDYINSHNEAIITILKYGSKFQYKENLDFLLALRKINSSQSINNKIKIRCFDVPYPLSIHPTLLSIRKWIKNIDTNSFLNVNEILFYSEKQIKKIGDKTIAKSIVDDFKKNQDAYQSILRDSSNFSFYSKIIEGIEISYLNTNGNMIDSLRELYLFNRINEQLKPENVSIVLCGNAHASLSEIDEIYYYSTYSSLGYLLKRRYPNDIFSILTHYYDVGLLSSLFTDACLIGGSYKVLFTDRKRKYYVIQGSKMKKYPEVNKRCDALIVKNCK